MQALSNTQKQSRNAAHGAPLDLRGRLPRLLELSLLALAAVFFALHFLHLTADFPNFSPWMDWSKYTDEGWYGDAAIRHFQLGHWYVPGDFNPAVALPVWPILEGFLFHFTGVSLVAARSLALAVFGATLAASWLLIARSARSNPATSITATIAVLLLAVSPFCFVFSRLAILEPPLVLFTLLALLSAQSARLPPAPGTPAILKANAIPILLLGLLLPIIILTKTTGVFLIPAVVWMLFAALEYKPLSFLRVGVPVAVIAGGLWLAYFLLLVRPHFLLDYRYLFSANAYTGMTRKNCLSVLWYTLNGGVWIGKPLFLTACGAVLVAFASLARLRRHPIIPALLLWAFGYAAFLAYHNNLQPRYYFVIAVPLTLLVPVAFRDLILPLLSAPRTRAAACAAAAIVLALIVLPEAKETLHFVRHPEYTFISAAHQVDDYIKSQDAKDRTHSPLVLSISGSDLSLMTGLHSICDDFGTPDLDNRVRQYNPGWYVAWNLIEDDKMDALTRAFHVTRVATFPAMDDQDRNLLIIYRLVPATSTPGHPRPRRRSRIKIGQQPSLEQLEH
jgi:4-amino-4-deoxy-L-arabinose transferase-like glycosyltransferase